MRSSRCRLRNLVAFSVMTLFSVSMTGCAWTWAFHRSGATASCDGEIVPMSSVPDDFTLRERQRIASRGQEIMLEIVAEKRGDKLVLVGLHRMGQKAFKIVQAGEKVSVQTYWGRPPVRPMNVLRDFHRVHFLALAASLPTEDEEERVAIRNRERIREVWYEGRLTKRIFERATGNTERITLLFGNPKTVRIENERCGYRTEILQSQ